MSRPLTQRSILRLPHPMQFDFEFPWQTSWLSCFAYVEG